MFIDVESSRCMTAKGTLDISIETFFDYITNILPPTAIET